MVNRPKKVIAFFDLDGTITRKDTLIAFLRFDNGLWKLLLAFIQLFPLLLQRRSASELKEALFSLLYKNRQAAPVYKKGEEFAMRILPKQIYQTALDSIKWHLAEGHDVCVVTASSPIWVAHWARQLGVQLIGTEYEIKDDKFTGHYAGNNCKGEEKVKRIRNQYDLSEYDCIYAYGDTPSDRPMLSLADQSFYKPFS